MPSKSFKDPIVFDIETIPDQKMTDLHIEKLNERVDIFKKNMREGETEEGLWNRLASTDPWYGQIVCIGCYRPNKEGGPEEVAFIKGTEKDILQNFWKYINGMIFKDVFISYNGLRFDVPFIIIRSLIHSVPQTSFRFINTRRYQTDPHFDVQMLLADWEFRKATSLEIAAVSLGLESPKEGEVRASNVFDAWKDGKIQEIGKYCIKDVITTYKIAERLLDYKN